MSWKDRAKQLNPETLEPLEGTMTATTTVEPVTEKTPTPNWKSKAKPINIQQAQAALEAIQALPETEKISPIEAAVIGAGQGATFDFGDELFAALTAPISEKTYRELQKEYEQVATQAAEQQKIAYYTGNIGAGLFFNPLAKITGAAVKGVGTLAAKGSKTLADITKAAPALGRIGQMGAEGAIYGGLVGAGQASADEDLVKEITTGVKSGAVVGTALGGAVQAGQKILKPVGERLKDTNIFKFIEDINSLKQKGLDPTASQANETIKNKVIDEAGKFIRGSGIKNLDSDSLPDLQNKLGKYIGDIRTQAVDRLTDKKITVSSDDIRNIVEKNKTINPTIADKENATLDKFLNKWDLLEYVPNENNALEAMYKPLNLDAKKANYFITDINEILYGKGLPEFNFRTKESETILKRLKNEAETLVDTSIMESGNYPEFQQVKQAYNVVGKLQASLGLPKGFGTDIKRFETSRAAFISKIKSLAKETGFSGTNFKRQLETLKQITNDKNYQYLPEDVRKKVETLVGKIDEFENLSRASELAEIAQAPAGFGESGKYGLFNSAKALLLKGTGALLDMPKALRETTEEVIGKPAVEASKKTLVNIKTAADIDFYVNKLAKIAEKKQHPKIQKYLESINQQDMRKRRAMLFVLLQQPSVRQMLEEKEEID